MVREVFPDRRWMFFALALVGALLSPHVSTLAGAAVSAEAAKSTEPGAPAASHDAARADGRPKPGAETPRATEPATKAEPSGTTVAPSGRALVDDRLKHLLRELYGAAQLPESLQMSRLSAWLGRKVKPLIVGLPEPSQSHMVLYYDQALVAVRQAASRFDYVQSHFDLPWQTVSSSSGPRSSSCRSNEQPGLMLFSGSPREPLLLVIFVTESPVLGVSRSQLSLALALAEDLAPQGKIPLLGPFFSGSAEVWAEVLARRQRSQKTWWYPEARRYEVVTGSATGNSVDGAFRQYGVSFDRTVPADDELLKALKARLGASQDLLGRRPLVKLVELGTVYGRDANAAKDNATYYFPLNIAEVRAQSEAAGAPRADLFPSLRRTLGLRLDLERKPQSDIPAPLSVLSPFVDDLALAQTLRRICDSRARYVVVSATDATDVIFLVQQARKFCRDLVIVTLGYESLFVHPDLAPTMAGVLNVSAFPPSAEAAELLGEPMPYAFPNWSSQGYSKRSCAWLRAGARRRRRPSLPLGRASRAAVRGSSSVRSPARATGRC